MASRDNPMQPVKVLRETATALEAAVLECVAKPKVAAVHKVRTTSRRIEAQLNLLPLLGGFPPYEDEVRKMRKLLKKLRQAAGAVRDLDVQQDLVAEEAKGLPEHETSRERKEARRLRRRLKERREKEAEALEELLQSIHSKLPRRVKALLDVLEPAEDRTVTETELIALIREWYNKRAERFRAEDDSGPDSLHGVRKVAKLARYLAEAAPRNARSAHALAQKFEAIQQSGGEWHDWLVLSELAASELGGSADLPQRFGTHAGEALADFQKRLRYRM